MVAGAPGHGSGAGSHACVREGRQGGGGSVVRRRKALDGGRELRRGLPKLSESQRLDPGGGTLLNLALCHEKLGKTASAWGEFKEALAIAKQDHREDRIGFAEQHIGTLEPQLSYLTIEVPDESAVDGLVMVLDEAELGQASWNLPLPVDPGERNVRAQAAGFSPWETTITVAGGGDRQQLAVPRLEALPPAPVAPAPLAPTAAPTPAPDRGQAPSGPNVQRIIGYGIGGLGVVSVVIGAVYGVRAIGKDKDADKVCGKETCPATPEGEVAQKNSDDARKSATMANAFLGAGAGLVAVGLVVVLTASDDGGTSERAASLSPWLGPGRAGLTLRTRW